MTNKTESEFNVSNTDIISRIKDVMAYYQLETNEFAENLSIDSAFLSLAMDGRIDIDNTLLEKIALIYDKIDKQWLFNGNGQMIKQ